MDSSSSSSSLVSRAKTAIHSAAAKAEKVLTVIKADLKSDRDVEKQLQKTAPSKEQMEHRHYGNPLQEDRIHAGQVDDSNTSNRVAILPSSVIKQLAIAVESSKSWNSIKDLQTSVKGSSPVSERAG